MTASGWLEAYRLPPFLQGGPVERKRIRGESRERGQDRRILCRIGCCGILLNRRAIYRPAGYQRAQVYGCAATSERPDSSIASEEAVPRERWKRRQEALREPAPWEVVPPAGPGEREGPLRDAAARCAG